MIYAFTGKTGSGKTFNMVAVAYQDWLKGRDTYSNTPLFFTPKHDELKFGGYSIAEYPELFSYYERLKDVIAKVFAKIKKRTYEPIRRGRIIYFDAITDILHANKANILFDEAQALFNARLWESLPLEFQHKLQQHRKHQLDLFATMQNMGTVAIEYRRLVQMWFHFEEVLAFGHDPVFLGLYRIKTKDIDFLYNSVDDLKVPDLKTKVFFIHKWKQRLYDTYFDIGFKRLRAIWITYKTKQLSTKRWMIIPKKTSLNHVLREQSTLQLALGLKRYQTSKKT